MSKQCTRLQCHHNRDEERPEGAAGKWGRGRRSKEARAYRDRMEDFVDTYTPEGNMRSYGDWKNAVKTNINQERVRDTMVDKIAFKQTNKLCT